MSSLSIEDVKKAMKQADDAGYLNPPPLVIPKDVRQVFQRMLDDPEYAKEVLEAWNKL